MFDERAFIAQLEAANTEELAKLVAHPTMEEEKVLRLYLGDEQYQRLHGLVLRQGLRRGSRAAQLKGNVVVLHGIMGSDLTAFDRSGKGDHIWANPLRLIAGQLARLRLAAAGLAEYDPAFDVRATGIMKRYYGELLLTLAENWNVRAFWYDWRKDLRVAAAELEARLEGWFAPNEPVHLVAHSMGGLVARTHLKLHLHRWQANPTARLIMLGTPNHGSFLIPQMLTGQADTLQLLARLDLRHSLEALTTIVNSFAGAYQMLPSPFEMPAMEPLYRAESYATKFGVSQRHLNSARQSYQLLQEVVDPKRMIYIAGCHRPTFVDLDCEQLKRSETLALTELYRVSMEGDGRVPHRLGLLKTSAGEPVPTYYIEETHADLSTNPQILAALDELLETGRTSQLSQEIPARRGLAELGPGEAEQQLIRAQKEAEKQLDVFQRRLQVRGEQLLERPYFSVEERAIADLLVRGALFRRSEQRVSSQVELPFDPLTIKINVVLGDITQTDKLSLSGEPIDSLALGHYLGDKLTGAILALDKAISRVLLKQQGGGASSGELTDADLLLTQYVERGTIRGELAQVFFLNDPRQVKKVNEPNRVIAVAGMGLPGRCGVPELTVLVRELCWALGRMGQHHLATILIGSGLGNLSVRDAVSAWIRGLKYAVTGASSQQRQSHLTTLTFVEFDPQRVIEINDALMVEKAQLAEKNRLYLVYEGLSEAEETELEKKARQRSEKSRQKSPAIPGSNPVPTRITVSLSQRNKYRFGAITEIASIPEREIPLDPNLVMQANNELVAAWNAESQLELGQFMERLLIPQDLRAQLSSEAPLVLLLDSTTARIHWELVSQLDPGQASGAKESFTDDNRLHFLGIGRGVTRQLRTTFAPPPEPPPPWQRLLRVLVVADPAEDAHLPGAEEEGIVVADLFERFNTLHTQSQNRIEVVRLFGPREATRTAVMRHLMLRTYDVLHFAGHCIYDQEDQTASGWIFSNGERITANELNRIDRVPKFVFSNACQSGITPDRSAERAVELAPSFAEAVFKQGVSNFICTAWPVDDEAAREFALRLYEGLLGLERVADSTDGDIGPGPQVYRYARMAPKQMYAAMRDARWAIANLSYGLQTWGAYQHYGNPFFRFFEPMSMKLEVEPEAAKEAAEAIKVEITEGQASGGGKE